MRGQKRDSLIRNYINFKPESVQVADETKSIRNSSKINKHFAKKKVFSSDKKYNYQLFIGDSKTPIGNFSLTLSDACIKNKSYRNKLFNSTDDSYRMRTLKLTKESVIELENDIQKVMLEIRNNGDKS